MRFSVGQEKGTVLVTGSNGEQRTVSRDVALQMWLHRPRSGSLSSSFAVLSFAIPQTKSGGTQPVGFVCVSDSDGAEPPEWPEDVSWAGPCPVWQPVARGEWIPVLSVRPNEKACQTLARNVLDQCVREQRKQEQQMSKNINDRCAEISKHGEDASFTESVDYYTTLRVKYAFLIIWVVFHKNKTQPKRPMNAKGLRERLRDVQGVLQKHRECLGCAPSHVVTSYVIPPVAEINIEDDQVMSQWT